MRENSFSLTRPHEDIVYCETSEFLKVAGSCGEARPGALTLGGVGKRLMRILHPVIKTTYPM